MKRILFILAAFSVLSSCGTPLRIAMNKTSSNGERNLLTTNQHLFSSGGGDVDIALGAKVTSKDTVMAFLITYDIDSGHGVFNKGNRLMFRLNDGSEIFLTNVYDKEYDEHEETRVSKSVETDISFAYTYSPFTDNIYVTPYEVTNVVPKVRHYKTTNSYALYLVTKPQLSSLMSKGIKKLRVETEDAELDMNHTENVSQLITDIYRCLQTAVLTQTARSQF